MFQQMQRTSLVQQPTHADYLALTMTYRPPTFKGGDDPVVLDDWQYKMNHIFRHIGCPDDRKVEVAIQFLDGPALQCWRSREKTLGNGEINWSWEKFIKMLRDHFFIVYHYDTKWSEFINLRQVITVKLYCYLHLFLCPQRGFFITFDMILHDK